MRNVRLLLVVSLLLAGYRSSGQQKEIVQNYISTYKDIAIAEMQRTGVPASIKLAQGIHETMAGTSDLVVKSNNHFGIKCKANWTGESVSHDDDLRGECFRKYGSPSDSYRDHSDFLKKSQRYAFLFKLDPLDYTSWAYGLKKAGYATNPRYPIIIIKLIEDYNLQDYTLIALGKGPVNEEVLADTEGKENAIVPETVVVQNEMPVKKEEETAKKTDYPDGEFRINETRVIYVKQGTAFLSIAQQYNISLARLFEFNDMRETESLSRSQLIYLQRKRKTGNNEFHVVKAEETLYDIAQEEAIRMDALLEYNQLQLYMRPAVGQRLQLRTKARVRPDLVIGDIIQNEIAFAKNENRTAQQNAVQVVNRSETYFTHTVQSKETVYSISRKYNVRTDDIAEWNQLSSYELKTGQQLKIYK
ncbi:MAG: LysM peptidoglycan-binding domain-containing protein [Chitinophagaceae bacterium]|nr:LysM peptidoglycan-binding domain-containing protein [Chitinophagaceae bacterium]